MKKNLFILVSFFAVSSIVSAQYAPAAGEQGSTAVHKDSSVFVSWATSCIVERGYVKISDTTFTYEEKNRASHGNDTNALAKADGRVVSLGDKGTALLTFDSTIKNDEGPDFAVFENSFRSQEPPQNYFLELAFVEVSSDGERFVRFPSFSETPLSPQTETFGQLDPTHIHNLAGKYVTNYGTPFDLEDLKDSTGIDLQNITHVKIIDVCGSIDQKYASYDSEGKIINDPYPTPFAAGGFDLDAVGVIHSNGTQTHSAMLKEDPTDFMVFPNPVRANQNVNIKFANNIDLRNEITINFYDITGKLVFKSKEQININIQNLKQGIYFVQIPELSLVKKIVVNE